MLMRGSYFYQTCIMSRCWPYHVRSETQSDYFIKRDRLAQLQIKRRAGYISLSYRNIDKEKGFSDNLGEF